MAEQTVTVEPSESKLVSFQATPHEARTYQVSVNGLTGSFVAIEKPTPKIVDASWETKWISGGLGGQLIKGKVTISSPKDFTSKIEVSLPGHIAKSDLFNSEQRQARIDLCNEKLEECYTFPPGRGQDVCIRYWTSIKEAWETASVVDGFYSVEEDIEHHVENMGIAVNSKSWEVNFPAGSSEFDFAFFIKADETYWCEEWWRIRYNSGVYQYSPKVNLYEEDKLVDSVLYENAIGFTIGEEWPIRVDIPSEIKSGEEFWASHTVHLGYRSGCWYKITLKLGDTVVAETRYCDEKEYRPETFDCRASYPLKVGGADYTFTGITKADRIRLPGEDRWTDPYEVPAVAPSPGTYRVLSTGRCGPIGYSSYPDIGWRDINMGITVEVTE